MNNITQLIFTFRKNTIKKFVAICSFLLISSLSFGQIAIPSSAPVTQNFTIGTTATASLPSNWKVTAAGVSAPTWAAVGNLTATTQQASSGAPTAGGIYNWGNGTTTTDRALGFMTSGGYASPNSIMAFYNNTSGVQINDLAISFDYERYRLNTAACAVTFFTSTDGTAWTARTAGDSGAFTTAANAYDFSTGTVVSRSFTISGINIPNGGNLYLRWNFNTTGANSQGVGLDNVSLTATLAPMAITSQASGNWSDTATWAGGIVPTSVDGAVIASGHTVLMDSGTYATRNAGTTTTVNAGGTLVTNQTYVNNGTTTINGSFQLNSGGWVSDAGGTNSLVYGSNGTLIFNTAYTANNGNYWPTTNGPVNVTVNSGSNLNLGFNKTVTGTFQTAAGVTLSSSTLTLNGICQLNNGGFFNNSPTYGSASTLIYNTSYGIFNEWTGNGAAGTGIPANVRVQSGTLTLTTSNRGIPGNITIDSGCSLTLNGTSGDLYIGGNWNNSGSFSPNGRAVFFNGATNQTITNTSGETFNYLINDKSAGSLIFANNVTINATSGNVLQIVNTGTIDLNGQTLVLANNGGNLLVNGGVRTITSSVAGGILSITGTKTVTSTSSGTLTLGANVTASLANGIDFGSSLTTIQGKVQVNTGGYVISNAPIYANTSTLEYNSVVGYGVNNEWNGNATTAGSGTPQNVILTNSSVNMPNAARSLAGNLTIGASSILSLNATLGADLNCGGNWSNSGTFNPNNRLVTFRGTLAQTLTGATTFDYLKINNSAGLTLNNPVVTNFTLDLTSGVITLGTNNLTIGSAGTVINANAASYVNTNGTGQFKRTVGASNILFPVGRSAYNPITFNNSGTSDVYGIRVADGAITTGSSNTKTVSRRWITTEDVAGGSNLAIVAQYNTGEPNTGFAAATTPFIGFYNGSTWSQVGATLAGSNPFTASSSTNSLPLDLTTGTQYFAVGKDNAFISVATTFVITSITPATPGAGYGFNVTVQSQDAFGNVVSVVANTSFALTTNGNAGVIGGTVTGTITAGTNSVVVSGVTLATAGTAVTVTATQTAGDLLSAGTSATFNVLAAASQLAFVGVPATGNVNVNLASFTVEARRPDNSVDTFYSGNITISKATGVGNLSGTVTVAAVNGVATFSTAQFDAVSTFTLHADSGSLPQITSGNIVVTLAPSIIAQFDFTTSPYINYTNKNANVNVTDIALSSGIIETLVTIGTFFPNEPYIEESTGWTATSQATAKNFNFTINANNGYQIEVTSIEYNAYSTGAGPTALSFDLGSGAAIFTTNAPNASPIFINQPITTVSNQTTLPVLLQGWLNGSRTSSGSGAFRLDDLKVYGYVTCTQPLVYTVTGGGEVCATGSGVLVGLSNSQIGMNYQLKIDGVNTGSTIAGTGAALSFGNQSVVGTYTVDAINNNNTCNVVVAMTGSATVASGGTTTWTGTPTPAWDNGTPTSTMTAIISENYSEPVNITACSLTVNNNAVVIIPSGNNVTLSGALNVTSGSFTLNNNANLVQTANVVNSGNINVKRATNPLMRFDYMAWSSPVLNQGLLSFSPLTSISPTVRFYTFTTSTNLYTSVGSPAINTATFDSGKSYLIRLPFNHPTAPIVWTGTFTGQPFNGPKSVVLGNDLTDANKRYNLIGNPYPSTLSIPSFASANSGNIEPTLYFWRKTNNASSPSYCTYNTVSLLFGDNGEAYTESPNGVIQVGQGFIVQAKPGATEVVFDNTHRIANNSNQVFRSSDVLASTSTIENNNFWLNMTGAATEFSQAVIGYHSNATQGVDDYDSKYFNDGTIAFTSIVDSQDYVIQGRLAPFNASDVVPMKYKVTNSGTYSIAIDHADGLFTAGAQPIYIKDNVTNAYHNLWTGAYSFTSAAGTFTNRFEVVYQNALNVDAVDFTSNNVLVYNQNNVLTINSGTHSMSSVKVFDVRGRLIVQKSEINASETQLNVGATNQVLILQITSSEGIVVSKKVMN